MAKPRKGKIKVRQKVGLRKKVSGDAANDAIPSMKPQMPRTNGVVLKVKMKKK